MYTEDDEKVIIKDDDSNDDYSDFYTSFNENKNTNNKKKGKKKKTKPKSQDEEEDSDLYGINDDEFIDSKSNDKGKKNIRMIIIAGILLIQVIIIVIILVGVGNKKEPDIILIKDNYTINVGETEVISYKIINTSEEIKASFKSVDTTVLTVDQNGKITGIDDGKTDVILTYITSGKEKEKRCQVTVIGDGKVDKKISLNLTLENGKDNVWTNKDVTIKVDAKMNVGINSIQ